MGGIIWVLASYNGLSWTVVIVLVVVAIYHFITTQTVLGRHIYAVGGNPEAAELSGISVKRIVFYTLPAIPIVIEDAYVPKFRPNEWQCAASRSAGCTRHG